MVKIQVLAWDGQKNVTVFKTVNGVPLNKGNSNAIQINIIKTQPAQIRFHPEMLLIMY